MERGRLEIRVRGEAGFPGLFDQPPLLCDARGEPAGGAGVFAGGPAFLVAGGPSFLRLDAGLLLRPGCLTMGVNNSIKSFRPDLWTCVDSAEHFVRSVWLDPKVRKFAPAELAGRRVFDSDAWRFTAVTVGACPNVQFYRRDERFCAETFLSSETLNWGEHARRGGGRSVMLPALRLLYHLGVRDVFLLGVDFRMGDGYAYHFEQRRAPASVEGNRRTYAQLARRFALLRQVFEEVGFHVWNCNPDSALEVFPFVPFEEAVAFCGRDLPADPAAERTEGLYDLRKDSPPGAPPPAPDAPYWRPPAVRVAQVPPPAAPDPEACAVVAGCDAGCEELLPWWLENLRRHCALPVAVTDFGMSAAARSWLAARGVAVRDLPVGVAGRFAKASFYKPYALLDGPRPKLLYLDLDCEIREDVSPLFAAIEPDRLLLGVDGNPVGKYRDLFEPEQFFNTGVIGSARDNRWLARWARAVEAGHSAHRSDQEVLNQLFYSAPCEVLVLPGRYNRLAHLGDEPGTAVMHWTGRAGKREILRSLARRQGAAGRPGADMAPAARSKPGVSRVPDEPAAIGVPAPSTYQHWQPPEVQDAVPAPWQGGGCFVTGCDAEAEWMLPWWLANVRQHSKVPVQVTDFGMTPEMRHWAGQHAEVIELPRDVAGRFGRAWFYKPYALLACTGAARVFLDLDCEVRGNPDPLFARVPPDALLLARDLHPLPRHAGDFDRDCYFNSGVVGASGSCRDLARWARLTEEIHARRRSDQEVLNELLYSRPSLVRVLPPRFNRLRLDGDQPGLVVMHWTGPAGKRHIRRLVAGDQRPLVVDAPGGIPGA